MDNLPTTITEKDKQILKAAAPLVIVVMLFFIVGKFGVSNIKEVRQQINNTKKTESVLNGKLKILQTVADAQAGADMSLIALPDKNPALSIISQIKLLSFNNSITVEGIKSSTPGDTTGLSYVTTTFTAIGTEDSILSFARGINNIAPVSVIEKMDISTNAGSGEASISIKTYYAPLPATIPTITQAVTDLNATEKSLLSEIIALTPPVFSDIISASASAINQDPFGR